MDVAGYSQQVFDRAEQQTVVAAFMNKVYGWMAVGLALTGVLGWLLSGWDGFFDFLAENTWVFFAVFIVQIVIALGSAATLRLPTFVIAGVFLLYAALNGPLFAIIFRYFSWGSIASTFFVTAGAFAALCLYGLFTKRDLSGMGGVLRMLVIGLLIAVIVNLFLRSSPMGWVITIIGVVLTAMLTAYNTNVLRRIALLPPESFYKEGSVVSHHGAEEYRGRVGIHGALCLYISFINLFLFLLRLMGGRK